MHAGSSTANASNAMHDVMNHAQVHNGMRIKRHALGTQIQRRGDEIERAQQRRDTEYGDRQVPTNSCPIACPVPRLYQLHSMERSWSTRRWAVHPE